MKRLLIILTLLFIGSTRLFAQDDDDQDNASDKIRDKMSEFIQKRLDVSKAEAEKFAPVFIRYFKEWRQTMRENKRQNLPILDRQQRLLDLQLRYRNQFREIIGERRGDQVFEQQRLFIKEMQDLRRERMNLPPPRRRTNKLF
jgi:hypothetical protein